MHYSQFICIKKNMFLGSPILWSPFRSKAASHLKKKKKNYFKTEPSLKSKVATKWRTRSKSPSFVPSPCGELYFSTAAYNIWQTPVWKLSCSKAPSGRQVYNFIPPSATPFLSISTPKSVHEEFTEAVLFAILFGNTDSCLKQLLIFFGIYIWWLGREQL